MNRKVKTYSQGMQQRLGLARVLLGRPEVLVLDEPTNGLDPGEMREVRLLVHRLADAGATVLFSSHVLAEVEQICTHAVVMDRGPSRRRGLGRRAHRELGVGVPRGRRRRPRPPRCSSGCRRSPESTPSPRVGGRHRRWHRAELVAALVQAGDRRRDGHRPAATRGGVPRHGGGGSLMATVMDAPTTQPTAGHPSTQSVVRAEFFKAGRRLRTYIVYGFVIAIPIIITFVLKGEQARSRRRPAWRSSARSRGC